MENPEEKVEIQISKTVELKEDTGFKITFKLVFGIILLLLLGGFFLFKKKFINE